MDHHNVYVVELDPKILKEDRQFVAANSQHVPGMPCVYVGRTGHTPEERFEEHQRGYKSSARVKEYAIGLLPELYERYNPMSWKDVQPMEVELANELRSQGYAVWQK